MFTLGIPKREYRRATQVLGYEAQAKDGQSIEFEVKKQDDDFYIFSFPEADEGDFRRIVKLLDKEEVRTIGGDTALTEKKIMKLADLITELAPTEEELNRPIWLNRIKELLNKWSTTRYQDDKSRAENIIEDTKVYIEEWESHLNDMKRGKEERERGVEKSLAEQKLRKLIRKTIRK